MNPPSDSQSMSPPAWREAESQLFQPGLWVLVLVGLFFSIGGCFFIFSPTEKPNDDDWLRMILGAVFGLIGLAALLYGLLRLCFPITIRHADRLQFPEVPQEPLLNGVDFPISFMSELVRQPDSWSLQPSPSRWRDGYYSLCAFIWLFLLVVTFVVSWSFMRGMEAKWSWFITALISTPVVTLFGFTFCCIVESVYQPLRNLSRRLTIPDDGGDLVFFTPGPDQPSRATRRRSASASEAKLAGQSQVLIRSDLIAVQLSPWYLEDNSDGDLEICHIVQGNLVFQKSTGSPINRLNIYCADDLVKGARVMKQLADILQVPFLFDADHQGWKLAIKQGRERGQTPRPRRFRSNLPSPSKGSGHQPRS